MLELVLVHRPRNGIPLEQDLLKKLSVEVPLWSTCLRQMIFVPATNWPSIQNDVLETDEVYHGHEAYKFLLQVVCGLRSPLVGETEVQGQFKQFATQISESHVDFWGLYAQFFQGVLAESKKIRSKFLVNLGSQSYGSILRKKLQDEDRVALLGSGQLVEELLPWLKKVKQIDIFSRRPEAAHKFQESFFQLKVHPLESLKSVPESSVIVIAAPVDNLSLLGYLKGQRIRKIVDLRGEEEFTYEQLQDIGVVDYENLKHFMKEITLDQQKISINVSMAEQMIQSSSFAFYNKTWFRPGGWEDLCG